MIWVLCRLEWIIGTGFMQLMYQTDVEWYILWASPYLLYQYGLNTHYNLKVSEYKN